ncbi:amidohydrolase [Agrobacterium rhizogenes]|uniref:M20 aminoacylase family protein n=1 Tax=Rhizobium rhizogenes TaxID=359 RepID=UPI001572B865|nr:M20 aminoacylase family protein [Rhizobium rhizogenes]NTF52927.1 amidohydrolase [Rhizobium rhizogenes]NTH10137.1 amidohydrolase [Rhizobium rhizogenes]NTH42689.1 amidohydrolase [Rhizobium rhizogenes]NTI06696.1 amidohydrolase [Rhizobium rhizogenes]NTI13501.1 amidohydrolase [Rhizobium rhizogenes]
MSELAASAEPAPDIIERIARYYPELVAIRHDLHAHPEIGFEEVRTSEIVAEKLSSWGIEVHRNIGRTGLVGRLTGRHPGNRSVGLRADMDALPMPEETGLPYASVYPNRFHGCGHDAHTTILLGTARYLAETRDFAGTVTFIFQPAEEGLGGAREMIADGLFERFPVDEIYGLHNSSWSPPNHLQVSAGAVLAGADFFDIILKGKGAHGAHPDIARDPIPAATELVQALQTIVSRNVKPTEPAVLSVTQIHGSSAYNVIPETVSISGTIRAFSDDVRRLIRSRLTTIARNVTAAHEIEVDIDIRDIFSVLTNHAEHVDIVADIGRQVLGESRVSTTFRQAMGSEDFADMMLHAPGAFFTLGHAGNVPAHNPKFIVDDAILPVGATLFARLVESRLKAA